MRSDDDDDDGQAGPKQCANSRNRSFPIRAICDPIQVCAEHFKKDHHHPPKKFAVATAICSLSRFESAPTIVRIDGKSACVCVAHTYEANVSKCVMHQKASARLVCVCLIVCNKCKHIAITRTRYVIVTIIVRVNCTWAETQLLLACVVCSTHANDHDGRFLLVSRAAGGCWTRPMVLYAPIYCKSISAIWAPESFCN